MKRSILKTTVLLALTGFSPLHAADPLAASLPQDSVLFFNASNLTKLRQLKDHPMAKTVLAGELGKALVPMMDKLSGEADAATASILKEETGLTLEEILAKFPGAAAGSVSLVLNKMMEDPTDLSDAGLTLVADFTGDEALMAKMLTALDKIEEKQSAEEAAKAKAADQTAKEDADPDEKDADAAAEETGDGKPVANWPGDYEEAVTETAGVKVHEWTVSDPDKKAGDAVSWSVANGKAAISVGRTDFKELVARLVKPATEGSLAATPAWKTLPDTAQESDLLMGVNLERLMSEMREGFRVQKEKGELETGGLPIDPLQAWTGLGLDKFRIAFLATTFEPEDIAMHMGITYAEKPAVMKIYATKGPGVPPAFIPADVQEVSWGTFDWGAMYDNLTAMATAVSPMAADTIEGGTTEMKKMMGVDLRKDILGQMGDALWSASHRDPVETKAEGKGTGASGKEEDGAEESPTDALSALAFAEGESQVIGIGLKDTKAFELSLKTIFNTMAPGEGLFDDRKFMGTTIHQIKGLPEEMKVAWLIHNETMMLSIGKSDLLEKIIGGMAKAPANALIEAPHIKAALAKLPEGGVSTGYADAGQMMEMMLLPMMELMSSLSAEGDAAEIMELIPEKLDLPWAMVSRLYLGDQSMDLRVRLSAKP